MALFLMQTIGGISALSYLQLDTVMGALASIKKKDTSEDQPAAEVKQSYGTWSPPGEEDVTTTSRVLAGIASTAYLGSVLYSIYSLSKLVSQNHSYVGGGILTSRKQQRIENWKWPVNGFVDPLHLVNRDGLLIYCREWQNVPSQLGPKAAVVLIHGLGMHSGVYEAAARQLNASGYIVRSFDMQGHGLSEGDRFFVRTWSDFVDDACAFVQAMQAQLSGLDIYMCGVSSGGIVTLMASEKLRQSLKGVILLSPTFRALDASTLDGWLGSAEFLLSKCLPHFHLYSNNMNGFTRSEQVMSVLLNDPMTKGALPARTVMELRQAARITVEACKTLNLPLLVLHGIADPIAPVSSSESFVRSFICQDKMMYKLKAGKHHELLLDENTRGESVELMVKWMDGHLAANGRNNNAGLWASSMTSSVANAIKSTISQRLH